MNEKVTGIMVAPVASETIPVLLDWPLDMWGAVPQVGDRYALEVYHVREGDNGNLVAKLRPVKL